MNPNFPEKKLKRLGYEGEIKNKSTQTSLPFLIFLVIIFLISYVLFVNVLFK